MFLNRKCVSTAMLSLVLYCVWEVSCRIIVSSSWNFTSDWHSHFKQCINRAQGSGTRPCTLIWYPDILGSFIPLTPSSQISRCCFLGVVISKSSLPCHHPAQFLLCSVDGTQYTVKEKNQMLQRHAAQIMWTHSNEGTDVIEQEELGRGKKEEKKN